MKMRKSRKSRQQVTHYAFNLTKGLLAAVFQHEADHLIGKVFVDRMTPEDRLKFLAYDENTEELEKMATDVCYEGYWKYID